MTKFQLNKIVRDLIVQKSLEASMQVDYVRLEWEEAILELFNKLDEEFKELKKEKESNNRLKELVDIQAVVNALYTELWISKSDFDLLVEQKRQEIWGFDQKLYIKTLEMEQDNSRHAYYKKDPEKFPEVEE